jgi:hypothetical protein
MSITNEEIIDEILHEAGKFGLLNEVIDTAKKIMEQYPNTDRVVAYEQALMEWVK